VHHAEDASYVASITDINTPWSNYKNLSYCTELAVEGELATQSWTNGNFNVTFNATAGTYTFANQTAGSGVFDITFDNTGSANMYGFSGVANSGASAYTSTYVAGYLIYPAYDVRSEFTDVYEERGISSLAISDSGKVHAGNARTTVPKKLDWVQPFEPQAMTHDDHKTATTYCTWQTFIEHCRQTKPFIVSLNAAGTNFECCIMRESTAHFEPEPMEIDSHSSWHVPFDTYFMGEYTQ
jgi:hypothetical protein